LLHSRRGRIKGFPVIELSPVIKNQEATILNSTNQKPGAGGTFKNRRCKIINKDIERGRYWDGIESMLREHHGVLKQTSSTTYPNVLCVFSQNLRESGQSPIRRIETKGPSLHSKTGTRMLSASKNLPTVFENGLDATPPTRGAIRPATGPAL